jgi:hypothetical protein
MRINLTCPYADKDKAKSLGARWDGERKVWYIVDVDDLKPFAQWLPILNRVSSDMLPRKKDNHKTVSTGHGEFRPRCACDVLPWEDCEHSEADAQKELQEILDLPF